MSRLFFPLFAGALRDDPMHERALFGGHGKHPPSHVAERGFRQSLFNGIVEFEQGGHRPAQDALTARRSRSLKTD